jgi:hypothetical protein
MENVYRILPNFIPSDIQRLIHLFAGTSTPSCKFIKLYIKQLNDECYVSRTDTLWCTLISKVLSENFSWSRSGNTSKDQELDLQIAFHLCSLRKYMQICDLNDMDETVKTPMREAFMKSVEKIQKEQTVRLRKKYRKCLEEDLLEEIECEGDWV